MFTLISRRYFDINSADVREGLWWMGLWVCARHLLASQHSSWPHLKQAAAQGSRSPSPSAKCLACLPAMHTNTWAEEAHALCLQDERYLQFDPVTKQTGKTQTKKIAKHFFGVGLTRICRQRKFNGRALRGAWRVPRIPSWLGLIGDSMPPSVNELNAKQFYTIFHHASAVEVEAHIRSLIVELVFGFRIILSSPSQTYRV